MPVLFIVTLWGMAVQQGLQAMGLGQMQVPSGLFIGGGWGVRAKNKDVACLRSEDNSRAHWGSSGCQMGDRRISLLAKL